MTAPPHSDGRVHVIGAGLAGLAAAVTLAGDGRAVVLYESASHAGGRCRSFHDPELGARIDNGNHLLLSGNRAVLSYIERIGALDTFERLEEAAIPFVDLSDGARWEVRPSRGALPWWIFLPSRRVPGTRVRDYVAALRLRRASSGDTVAAILDRDTTLSRRLWEPLVVAALNTSVEQASAALFSRLLAETIGRGAAACRPLLARDGLSESLVDPALTYLSRHGAEIRFGSRLRALGLAESRVA
ncbi:MAG TPA: FAD-dependent oxidoreductase, partial [Stellaceae bacterium]|nr:FAD-dependent oxidoreductase [Stellaceae bacterium]